MSTAISTQEDSELSIGGGLMAMAPTASLAIQLAGAMLDKRISTARAYPRSIAKFKKETAMLLREDIETARSAEYAKPVGGGVVRGPSVRLAELMAMCWTNIDIEVGEPIVGDKSVTVMANAWDLERNYRAPGMASVSILKKDGSRMPGHVVENLVLATASKARRNAILAIIPKSYVTDLLQIAKEVANGEKKPLEQVRIDTLDYFARTYKVTADQIFEAVGVRGIDDLTDDHIADLRAIATSIKEGGKIEEFFKAATATKGDEVKEKIAARRAAAVSPPPPASPPAAKSSAAEVDQLAALIKEFEAEGGSLSDFEGKYDTTMEQVEKSTNAQRSKWISKFTAELREMRKPTSGVLIPNGSTNPMPD